ncbi:MAG: hypothetical protein ABI091_20810 [Ferruginibacter sp.]
MRTIRTKVYKFNELSENAKDNAIERWRNSDNEMFWSNENRDSMKAFADMLPITVKDWSYGGRGEGVYFTFDERDEIEELTGQRLATYLWNNYKNEIYSKKYLGDLNVKHCVYHNRIKTKDYKNGNFGNAYYSAISIEKYNCPFTGYCMDNEILAPMYEFMDKPNNRTNFKELIEECFDAWIKACNNDIDYQNSDEYIIEQIEANEYEFTQDGKMI